MFELAHYFGVKFVTPPLPHKVAETGELKERGYASWKRAKIEYGLEQSKDRNTMISSNIVWRELGLET